MDQGKMMIEVMRAAGLGELQIQRLVELKRQLPTGQYDELTIEYKRLMFVQFLRESGRIQD